MKTIGKTKKNVLSAAGMKNKTAPPGFTRFFRFAGLLPIGAGFAKRNDGPQCPPQAKKMGFGVRFIQKTQAPQGGQRPPQAEKFLGIWGRCTQKSRCWDAFRNVFLPQNTPQNPQIFRSGGPNPQMTGFNPPPPCYGSALTRGGVILGDMG